MYNWPPSLPPPSAVSRCLAPRPREPAYARGTETLSIVGNYLRLIERACFLPKRRREKTQGRRRSQRGSQRRSRARGARGCRSKVDRKNVGAKHATATVAGHSCYPVIGSTRFCGKRQTWGRTGGTGSREIPPLYKNSARKKGHSKQDLQVRDLARDRRTS